MGDQQKNTSDGRDVDWHEQLDRHHRWLRAVVIARCGEPQAADEIMQEVAVAAIAQKSPIREPTKVEPWLYQLAVRQSLMYRRKQGRRRKLEERYANEMLTQPKADHGEYEPLAWLLADERRKHIRQAVRKLNPRDAEILLLKYTEDWNYQQIADHLGISHSAVESRLHRARQRLRDELTAMNVIEAKT